MTYFSNRAKTRANSVRMVNRVTSTFQREFVTRREEFRRAGDDLAAWLDAENIPASAALVARLALDELVANVAAHGADDGREPIVSFTCNAEPGHLLVQVDDDGLPFDPRQVPSPDLDVPLDERRIGGLGLHLLRRLASRFDYERRDGRNRVTLAADYEA
jgi:serine/threonine-protein kinase RsbW